MNASCTFCRIVRSELPSYRVAETEGAYAFLDIDPATSGHALVIPKQHRRDLFDATPHELAELLALAQRVGAAAMNELGAPGVKLHQVSGAAAGQDVFHLHFHVIPRYLDDTVQPSWHVDGWSPPGLSAEQQTDVAARLCRALGQ